ncbi:MAG: hypothetical protein AAGI54_02490 [Planctomycetota bacterium]
MPERKLDIVLNGKDRVSTTLGRVEQRLGAFVKSAGVAVAAMAAATTAALAAQVKQQFGVIDSLAKMSDQIGISTEDLIGLRHAAELTGVGADKMSAALAVMQKRLGEAAQGRGTALPALEALGIQIDDIIALSPDKQFIEIAKAMQAVATQAEKNALAANIFSRANQNIVNTLALGEAGLRKAQVEAERLGLTMSREAAAGVEEANDALVRLDGSITGMSRELTVGLAPAIAAVADEYASLAQLYNQSELKSIAEWLATQGTSGSFNANIEPIAQEAAALRLNIEALDRQISDIQGPRGLSFGFMGVEPLDTAQLPKTLEHLDELKAKRADLVTQLDGLVKDRKIAFPETEGIEPIVNRQLEQAKSFYERLIQGFQEAVQRSRDAMRPWADQLVQETRTPLERLGDQLRKTYAAAALGVIDEETLTRSIAMFKDRAREQLDTGLTIPTEAPGLPDLRESRLTTGVAERQRSDRRADEAIRLAKRQADEQKRIREQIAGIESKLGVTPAVLGWELE